MDQKVHQQVEFVKDPANIDEALDEIVKYHESQQSGKLQQDGSNKTFKAQAASVYDIHLVMEIWIVMKKVVNQIELPMPISCSADNIKVMVSPTM